MHRFPRGIASLIVVATLTVAQTPSAPAPAKKPALAKAKPKTTPANTPSATPADATTPAPSKLESRGFQRVDVTPATKTEFEAEMRVAVIAAPRYWSQVSIPFVIRFRTPSS